MKMKNDCSRFEVFRQYTIPKVTIIKKGVSDISLFHAYQLFHGNYCKVTQTKIKLIPFQFVLHWFFWHFYGFVVLLEEVDPNFLEMFPHPPRQI